MNYKVSGKILAISEVLTLDSGAKKLNFQLDNGNEYNNIYSFDVFKGVDHIQHIDNFIKYNLVGDNVTVEFSIRTNEYNGKFYTTLSMWRCEKVSTEQPTAEQMGDASDELPY